MGLGPALWVAVQNHASTRRVFLRRGCAPSVVEGTVCPTALSKRSTCLPLAPRTRFHPQLFRVLLLRCLSLPLPSSCRSCRCGLPFVSSRYHRATRHGGWGFWSAPQRSFAGKQSMTSAPNLQDESRTAPPLSLLPPSSPRPDLIIPRRRRPAWVLFPCLLILPVEVCLNGVGDRRVCPGFARGARSHALVVVRNHGILLCGGLMDENRLHQFLKCDGAYHFDTASFQICRARRGCGHLCNAVADNRRRPFGFIVGLGHGARCFGLGWRSTRTQPVTRVCMQQELRRRPERQQGQRALLADRCGDRGDFSNCNEAPANFTRTLAAHARRFSHHLSPLLR